MEQKHSTRWGGRAERFAQFPGAVSRCHDPYDGNHPVQFDEPIKYEAWVRWRFHPDTLRISHHSRTLTAWDGLRPVQARPTFVVTSRDMTTTYHLVADAKRNSGLSELLAVADRNGAQVKLTLRDELRAKVALFWRLELLRSASALHVGEGAEIDSTIHEAVLGGCTSRSALQSTLRFPNLQLLDARLGHLHCAGSLLLNFDTDDFGVTIRQEVAR